jgi:hypothetical protein
VPNLVPIQAPTSNFTFTQHWHLQIDNKHPGNASFTAKDGSVTEIARIDWSKSYDAILDILGYSMVVQTSGSSSGYALHRVPPIAHPYYNWMYATRISNGRGVQFNGQTVYNKANAIPSDARYSYFEVEVTFEPLRFQPLKDGVVTSEYLRYTSYDYKLKSEFVEVQTGSLKFAESGPTTTIAGKQFPGRISGLENKVDFCLTWHQVPENWIADTTTSLTGFTPFPPKIMAAVGCVNSDLFLGQSPGTLLMLPPEITRWPAPLVPRNLNGPDLFYVDVKFNMVYFKPELGASSPIQQGHNNKPFVSGTSSEAFKYYMVTHDGTGGGRKIYQTANFANCFSYWGAP